MPERHHRDRPRGRHSTELQILVDSREQYAYRFSTQQATTVKGALPCGDYRQLAYRYLAAAHAWAETEHAIVDRVGIPVEATESATAPEAASPPTWTSAVPLPSIAACHMPRPGRGTTTWDQRPANQGPTAPDDTACYRDSLAHGAAC